MGRRALVPLLAGLVGPLAAAETIAWSGPTLTVPEGGSATASVRLLVAPPGPVVMTIQRSSGDGDVAPAGPGWLLFTPQDWSVPKAVVIAAGWDDDVAAGSAVITASATVAGWVPAALTVVENEDAGGLPPATPGPITGPSAVPVGVPWAVTVAASDPDTQRLRFHWSWGDGTTTVTTTASATRAFAEPGHYQVLVTVDDGVHQRSASRRVTVHRPLSAAPPRAGSQVVVSGTRAWTANPDAGTVTAFAAATLERLREIPVGAGPAALEVGGDGRIWVAVRDADRVLAIHPDSGAISATVALPRGSRPASLVRAGAALLVVCAGDGRLRRIDPAGGAVTGSVDLGPSPQAIAVTGDGGRALVTRFLSPDHAGIVTEVDVAALAVLRTIPLALDPGPDTEISGRGLPNHLAAIAIGQDGHRAWVAAKKDNIGRGGFRDGQPLTFESTVRAISAAIDLAPGGGERMPERIDYNNAEGPSAIAFSPLGDWVFVALQGNGAVAVVDPALGQEVFRITDLGFAPQGLCLGPDGRSLLVHNALSRTLVQTDLAPLLDEGSFAVEVVRTGTTTAVEPLAPEVLLGKRLFHHAVDPRLSRDSYISCASCHAGGGSDGRIWDFTDRGEGLRRTTDLRGRRGTGHGRVHWSGNFDEIQDFENDIRNAFGGTGLMTDPDFAATSHPLGAPKAGRSAELDALAAYVRSLSTQPPSPHRAPSGTLTPAGVTGRAVFEAMDCTRCHAGADYTDSPLGLRHDVGTITAGSGKRLGGTLDGIETPTLNGVWAATAFLHHGGAASLEEVFASAPATSPHAAVRMADIAAQQALVAFLRQLDGSEPAANARPVILVPAAAAPAILVLD
jgi:DNA-binding beta-propeller fold protein YncE